MMQAHVVRWLDVGRIVSAAIGFGLLAATIALPAAVSAADSNYLNHRWYSDEMAHVRAATAESGPVDPLALTRETCHFLSANIADYDCAVPLAEYAGKDASRELLLAPDGVEQFFWEANVLITGNGNAVFASSPDPQSVFHRPSDFEIRTSAGSS